MRPPRPGFKVLVVEDDAEQRGAYRRLFDAPESAEFTAEIVPDGERALAALARTQTDILVVDWGLPGISGTSLIRALRAHPRTRAIAILMVTGRGSADETVAALDSGADDHLPKPFDGKVLLARLRGLARRRDLAFTQEQHRRHPGLDLDLESGRLRLNGKEVPLRLKELELLKIFLRRPGMIHSRSYLWESVWGGESEGWSHVLDETLSSLRRKLGPAWGARLKSLRGQGCLFDA